MQFGDYRVEIVPDCEFRLDGGAMFGVVPRNLWSKVSPPDDQNRIRMNMNCVFIEGGGERILIETGIGNKWSDKRVAMYGIDRKRSLDESLRSIAGVAASEITIVINTHLHFDHAGGNTILDESGKAVPTFLNARYFISRAEYEHAEAPSERDRASYFTDNWRPIRESGQLELKAAAGALDRKRLAAKLCPGCAWKPMPATIDRCSAGVWIAAAGRCLDLPTWCRPARTYHWPGSWATIFIRLRRLKRKRKSCRKQRARIGPVCSITIRTNLWDELRKPKGSYEALLLKANV